MFFDISEKESKNARWPHELLLINLITNHILVFVALLGMAGNYPWLMLIPPVISIAILSYLLIRAKQSTQENDGWFTFCHWQLCAQRSRFFILMLGVLTLILIGLLLSVGGDPDALKPGHYAIGGVAILPTMITILALIVMESDAIHKAKMGTVPVSFTKKYPDNQPKIREINEK